MCLRTCVYVPFVGASLDPRVPVRDVITVVNDMDDHHENDDDDEDEDDKDNEDEEDEEDEEEEQYVQYDTSKGCSSTRGYEIVLSTSKAKKNKRLASHKTPSAKRHVIQKVCDISSSLSLFPPSSLHHRSLQDTQELPKKRGRPPKSSTSPINDTPDTKRPRGRPPKTPPQKPIAIKKTPIVATRNKTPVVATRNKTPVVPKRITSQNLTLHDKVDELSKDIHSIKDNIFQIYDMFATFVETYHNDEDEDDDSDDD
jgi:hypothetical protein